MKVGQRQSDRVNGIIDNVLQLSRRKILNKTTFLLSLWLDNFVEEFRKNEDIPESAMLLTTIAPLSQVRVDQEQLRQIMVNLCSNAWHYSEPSIAASKAPQVLVRMGKENDEIVIDVLDNGAGVSETALPQLFEPFYSERTGGIGLGLFLAREMAQANGLRLNYIAKQGNKGLRYAANITWRSPGVELNDIGYLRITDFKDRVAMLEAAVKKRPKLHVSAIEQILPSPSYSIDTLRYLKIHSVGDVEFYFITGADSFLDILSWKEYQDLLTSCHFIVYTRKGNKAKILQQFFKQLGYRPKGDCWINKKSQKSIFTSSSALPSISSWPAMVAS